MKRILSPSRKGKIKGWTEGNWGEQLEVTATAGEVKAKDYTALVIPGGVMNPDKLRMDKDAVKLVKVLINKICP